MAVASIGFAFIAGVLSSLSPCVLPILPLVLGAAWSPCVGPTLGAASVLAAQGRDMISVVLTMLAFGIGAALPLLLLGLVSREVIAGWRHRLLRAGERGKVMLGALTGLAGFIILMGLDKPLETVLVAASPEWLTRLTTTF